MGEKKAVECQKDANVQAEERTPYNPLIQFNVRDFTAGGWQVESGGVYENIQQNRKGVYEKNFNSNMGVYEK